MNWQNPVRQKKKKKVKKVGRTSFNTVLKECRELLSYMGVECVQAQGEAEALCAYLNVDGVNFLFISIP